MFSAEIQCSWGRVCGKQNNFQGNTLDYYDQAHGSVQTRLVAAVLTGVNKERSTGCTAREQSLDKPPRMKQEL